MKNLKFLILSIFSLSMIYSCRSEEKYYDGDNALHFSVATKTEVLVPSGASKVVKIECGSLGTVNSDTNVNLVMDSEASDSFQAGAIEILNGGQSVISKGSATGYFEVKVSGDYLTFDSKKAIFKLESSSMPNAVFNQVYTLTASQVCLVSSFVGTFNNDSGWWVEAPNSTIFQIVEGDTPNTLVIKDFFETGRDFNLEYNPETFVITFETQFTGWNHSQGPVSAKLGATTSTFNPCTREVDLHVEYVITGVGTFGEKNEHFVGQ